MLNIENCALIVIDIQEKLVLATKYGSEVAINASKLVKAADILNIPTIITEQYPQGLGATVAQVENASAIDTYKIEKSAFSALQEAEFEKKITELNKKQIILCGIETHICVFQTAVELLNAGYEVFVIKDACASRQKKEYKAGLDLLKQYGAKVTCIEIALFELLKTSKHPKFKQIQALIK